MVSSNEDGKKYKITVSDNVITIVIDGETYKLNYDLTDKPTFVLEIPIEQGMSYDKFMQETSNLTFLPMLGYVAVANIQGVESKDAGAYFLMLILGTVLSSPTSGENSYTIVDDINTSLVYDKYEVNEKDLSCTSQDTNGNIEVTLITCASAKKKRLVVKCRAIT